MSDPSDPSSDSSPEKTPASEPTRNARYIQAKHLNDVDAIIRNALVHGDSALTFNSAALRSLSRLSEANPSDVQKIASAQLELLTGYHQTVLQQAGRSFFWALVGAGVGLLFFLVAAGYVLWTGNAVAAIVPVVAGGIVEVVSGLVFWLYGKTAAQLSDFHLRLETLQRYMLANSMCERLTGEQKDKTRSDLIRHIATMPGTQAADAH